MKAALIAAALLFATNAQGTVLLDAPFRWQAWVNASKVPTPAVEVTVVRGHCPWYPPGEVIGCSLGPPDGEGHWTVWVSRFERDTLLHELGHIYRAEYVSDRETYAWARAYGGPWHEEQFADVYMTCAKTRTPARMCRLIEQFRR